MLENEIIPLYFEKNSKGYSPRWIEYIKNSIGHIAPHFTMKRMIDDYITRFYNPEALRFNALANNDCALAKEIVAWKEKVVSEWDGIKVLDFKVDGPVDSSTGQTYSIKAVVDTNGIGRSLALEFVAYRVADGEERLYETRQFSVTNEDNGILTYELHDKIHDAGVYRYGFRLYPTNPNLAHRQDFAYVRWI